ncbi:hypothetical protein [Rhizobium sp. ZW T2_16]|uniref:hypothetical protein n=1 Tax=Rhizobium sp. ZW T2_16 TaxID=3378083 RepID=UPI0038550929
MDRRQARIDRRLEKLVKQQEKAARLVVKVEAEQKPRQAFSPEGGKSPRSIADPGSIMQMRMEYTIHDHSDRKETWTWGEQRNWCHPEYGPENACIIRATMIEMSGLYWHEIMAQMTGGKDRHKKHHSQPFDSICPEAQDRWIEIGRVEDELFRFLRAAHRRLRSAQRRDCQSTRYAPYRTCTAGRSPRSLGALRTLPPCGR